MPVHSITKTESEISGDIILDVLYLHISFGVILCHGLIDEPL